MTTSTAKIIDGKATAAGIRQELAAAVAALPASAPRPGLAVVQVGEDPASSVYVRSKTRACEEVGYRSFGHHLPEAVTEEELLALVAELNAGERDLGGAWPATLRTHYGLAFSIARRLAGLLTLPRLLPVAGPVGMRSRALMTVALRVMGNLVTDADRDLTARAWRAAGRLSIRLDDRPPFPAADLRK